MHPAMAAAVLSAGEATWKTLSAEVGDEQPPRTRTGAHLSDLQGLSARFLHFLLSGQV